ncbi:MAG: hypothetical protein LBC44_02835 [Mycoplasmataceae bacterium]|jgi:hypothetical protein|nr:hypothetical protein [Mycoplasmataceae bacterium]
MAKVKLYNVTSKVVQLPTEENGNVLICEVLKRTLIKKVKAKNACCKDKKSGKK